MNSINERFKTLRKSFKMSQEEWGKILGITRVGVSEIEAGRRNVTDKHIRLLCVEPIQGKYINENWLRNEEDEMFVTMPEEDEMAAYVEDLLADDGENEFYAIIKGIMKTYNELSPKSQEVLRDASAKLVENLKKERED
ncbi:helix-turn-helix domain-containing protein [Faecalimonas sp.]